MKRTMLLLLVLCLVPVCWAQEEEDDSKASPDRPGCTDSKTIGRLPGCKLEDCEIRDYDAAELFTGPDDNKTTVEGAKEYISYACPDNLSPLQMVRNVQNALTAANFKVVFNGKSRYGDYIYTARKGGHWVSAQSGDSPGGYGNGYVLTTVVTKEMEQYLDAKAIESEINKTGRIAVYGITFDTSKATVKPESAKVLEEIATALKDNPTWKLTVEGHTDNQGSKLLNQRLSEQRAASVVDRLVQQGVAKTRLTPAGFGDSKPVADNNTDDGRAQNRRVELVRQ